MIDPASKGIQPWGPARPWPAPGGFPIFHIMYPTCLWGFSLRKNHALATAAGSPRETIPRRRPSGAARILCPFYPCLGELAGQRICAMLGAALLAVLAYPSVARAQDLVDGTWSGTMTQPNARGPLSLEYEITHDDDGLAIVMVSPMGRMRFSGIEFSDGVLRFTWHPGPLVECQLEPQGDGGYSGDCVDQGGARGQLRMVPPVRAE